MIAFGIQAQKEDEIAYRLGRLRDLASRGLIDPNVGTLPVQGRLLIEACIRITPFRTLAQANQIIGRDLSVIFNPLRPESFDNPRIKALIIKSDAKAWDQYARNAKGSAFAGTYAVKPTVALHKTGRLPSTGRPRRGLKMVTLPKDFGAIEDVKQEALKKAGWSKSGWLHGYFALNGNRAPAWVTRHRGPGAFTDGTRDPAMPFISVRNSATFFRKQKDEGESLVQAALRARTTAMKSYFETMQRLAAEGTPTPFQLQQLVEA